MTCCFTGNPLVVVDAWLAAFQLAEAGGCAVGVHVPCRCCACAGAIECGVSKGCNALPRGGLPLSGAFEQLEGQAVVGIAKGPCHAGAKGPFCAGAGNGVAVPCVALTLEVAFAVMEASVERVELMEALALADAEGAP
eukprot:3839951-Pleurochrysis_carterae.AAC.1